MNISAPSAASPVQPFFSNIGVSVGMPWRLLSIVSTTARCVRFITSLELAKDPVSGASVWTALAVNADSGGGASPGQPVTWMYWKPL